MPAKSVPPYTLTLKRHLLPAAILLIAFALRLIAIDDIPPGLSHDEAYNGVTAIDVLEGERRVFFEINKGIEPLIIYLEAAAFHFFGIRPVSLRLVNVFCGLLTVALIYPLTARLFNRRVAMLAMAGVAISFWAIFVSRLTLRAVTLPPLLLLTLYLFWRGLEPAAKHRSKRTLLLFFGLTGLAAGATMYTYLSSRFLPFILLAIFGYQVIRRQITRTHWWGLLLCLSLLLIIFTPLGFYYWENAESFTRRSSQVSTLPYLLNGEVGQTLESTLLTLGMFTFYGDETDRYNLDGRPIFDWINGLMFYLGLAIILLRLRRPPDVAGPAAVLIVWFFFMLLPDFITDDSPHFLRTIGALPVVYIAWAVGLDSLSRWLAGLYVNTPILHSVRLSSSSLYALLIAPLLLGITLHTSYDYFNRWAEAAGARAIYGADIAAIAAEIKQNGPGDFPAISTEYYRDLDQFHFALQFHNTPPFAIWFDGRQSLAFPPPESGLRPRYFSSLSAPLAEPWHPFLEKPTTKESYSVYHMPDDKSLQAAWLATFPPENRINVNVNDDLLIAGYQVLGSVVSGGQFDLLLGWQALRTLPPDADYTFLARLRDSQGHIWVEADGNGYAPGDWQPGVRGLQLLTLRLPGDLPPRPFHLTVEVVDRQRQMALPTASGESVIHLDTIIARLDDDPQAIEPDRLPNPLPQAAIAEMGSTEPRIALRGYELSRRRLQPGDTTAVTLHWEVIEQPRQDYQLEFFLANREDSSQTSPLYRWSPLEPMNQDWPTGDWPTGYWVQDRVDLLIESEMPTGQFELWGRWVTPEATPFGLGSIWIESP